MAAIMCSEEKIREILEKHILDSKRKHQAAVVSVPVGLDYTNIVCDLALSKIITKIGKAILIVSEKATFRPSYIKNSIRHRIESIEDKIGVEVVVLNSSWHETVDRFKDKYVVYVATPTIIKLITDKTPDLFKDYLNNLSAILIEECLTEKTPALANKLQETRKPICIITSSRYWCDIDRYDFDRFKVLNISHQYAIERDLIDKPQFEIIEYRPSAKDYVHQIVGHPSVREAIKQNKRIVVRCDSRKQVLDITEALTDRGHSVIGVTSGHLKKSSNQNVMSKLPKQEQLSKYSFIVHHDMLTRSYADVELCVLVVLGDFVADGDAVQQIGRIISKNASRQLPPVVLSRNKRMEEAWNRYIEYEKNVNSYEPRFVDQNIGAKFWYWGNNFEKPIDLLSNKHIIMKQNILFKYSTIIRQYKNTDFSSLVEGVRGELTSRNCSIVESEYRENELFAAGYICTKNSPYLDGYAYPESRFEYIVLCNFQDYLFVSTSDSTSEVISDETHPIPTRLLTRLLAKDAKISSISLKNNYLSSQVVRSRALTVSDMAHIVGQLEDSSYSYSTVLARIEGERNRYIGTKESRFSEPASRYATLDELESWFKSLAAELNDDNLVPNSVLSRYSQPVQPSGEVVASNILLDVDLDLLISENKPVPGTSIESLGGDVVNNVFEIVLDGKTYKIKVQWMKESRRFFLSCESRTEIEYEFETAGRKRKFLDFLNRNQSFRIVTSEGYVYTDKTFWSIENSFKTLRDLGHYIEAKDELGDVEGEKYGDEKFSKKWPSSTVFGQIAYELMPAAFENDSEATILCTDMGAEVADFVGYSKNKIVFAHAKANSPKRKTGVSASALHEVVSQAIKNLKYLTVGNTSRPDSKRWSKNWNDGKAQVDSEGISRLCKGSELACGEEYWRNMDSIIQSHGVIKEVWLVLGNSLSRSELMKELEQDNPRPYAVQVITLLSSLAGNCHNLGIYLKVYCSN